MHRSVLQNKEYIKFSRANVVEVIAMEEIRLALKKEAPTIATYKAKDAYGDEVQYLEEFAGLTIDDLTTLSNTNAILRFSGNGGIPFTVVVDPHTGKVMQSFQGKYTVAALTAAIKKARVALDKEHGKGVDRKLWDELGAVEVKVDLALAKDDYAEAVKLHSAIAAKFKRPADPVKERLDILAEQIFANVKKALEKKDLPANKKDEYQRLLKQKPAEPKPKESTD